MTAASTITQADLDLLHADVRQGWSCVAAFSGPWLEVMGRRGMRPAGDYLVAPVPTLRLWVPGRAHAPEAVAVAHRDFEGGLRLIEERGRTHLHADEARLLALLLGVVRRAAKGMRRRVPPVAETVIEEGTPSLHAWAFCLTPGDLQAALLRSAA